MQDETQYLCGTVEGVTFYNEDNGFTVLSLCCGDGETVTVVGALAGAAPGEGLELAGRYVEHRAYGPQFEAAACRYVTPQDTDAILKYLASGVLPGIGPVTAGRIVQKFGDRALEMLASRPEALSEVRGFSAAQARAAGARFADIFGLREAVAALARLGLSAAESIAVYRSCGAGAAQAVYEDPYRLCAHPLYLSFARADAIAEHTGLPRDEERRLRAAVLYTLRHNLGNGHTCLPREKLLATVVRYFGAPRPAAEAALDALAEAGEARQVCYGGIACVYLAEALRAEMSAALRVREMAARPAAPLPGIEARIEAREAQSGIRYAHMQKEAIAAALSCGAVVITGGPGTGKTTAVKAIIALYEQMAERVLLAAPTGRAAKRMAELTGRGAATIHRLLEAEFAGGGEAPRFRRNAENPLRCDVLVVDEMSMVDAFLFESLLAALRPGCRLVMVGDADQLPSVGPGNVLRGIITSGAVRVVALGEIFRQAAQSLIVSNAHRIVEGLPPVAGGAADDFFFVRSAGGACRALVCGLAAERLPARYGFSPMLDIQVLCPGRRGPLGTEELNARLQELLNPPAPNKPELRRFGVLLRAGDKVMQTKNNYDIPFTRANGEPGAGAFNGDIGVIEEINPAAGTLVVLCDERRVCYAPEFAHELELAYAVTVHKSQGSEFEAVIIPLSETPARLQYRNLLYTGITRAKRLCVLAGEEAILRQMVNAGSKNRRYSCFAEFLCDGELI